MIQTNEIYTEIISIAPRKTKVDLFTFVCFAVMSTCVKRNHENIQDMVGENIDLQNVPKSTSYFNKNRRSYGPLDGQFYFSIPVIFGFADKLTQIVYNIKHSRKSFLLVPIQFTRNTHLYLLLFQCENVSLNQGPVKNHCGVCNRPIAIFHDVPLCEACYYWHHIKCVGISSAEYFTLGSNDEPWCC